jgi:cyclopropane fatty-acyl-phospholipid synthase-like methyltransferase
MKTAVENWLEGEGEEFLRDIGIGEGQRVLDFGCGEGVYAVPAARVVGDEGRVYALDRESGARHRMMEKARAEGLYNIEPVSTWPGEPGSGPEERTVDVVLLYDVLHYMDAGERKNIYAHARVILKDGALLSVYPKHCISDESLWHLADMELEDVVKEIEEAGFRLERKLRKKLIHDEEYATGRILNFRK